MSLFLKIKTPRDIKSLKMGKDSEKCLFLSKSTPRNIKSLKIMGSNLKPWVQVEEFIVKMEVVHDENRPGKVTKYKPKLFYDIETTKRNFAYPHGPFMKMIIIRQSVSISLKTYLP
uniref:Uncharacterized protein n=1 Tax=Cacopsylla melanoneura TaxID=428564 RepID=A0A8D9ALQ8_9HEMI